MNLIILIATFVLIGVNALPPQKIKAGYDSMVSDYPFMVRIQVEKKICGGVLISRKHVMTAAQCLTISATNRTMVAHASVRVALAQQNMNNIDASKIYEISHANVHGKWLQQQNLNSLEADLAILTLTRNIPAFTLRSIDIPERAPSTPTSNTEGLILGWGTEEAGGKMNAKLQEANIRVIDFQSCKMNNYPELTEYQFCAQFENNDATSCDGDVGGPFIDDWGRIAGIISRTSGCKNNSVNILTDITQYKPWIQQILKIASSIDPNTFSQSDKSDDLYEKI